ncbi:unnamed protein product [Cylicocyclus nassatus]|uniref:Uncharacterized protein n=1 Tax=Cylicocyclus nassatus TaxID=53992 RepID=A0AA36H841_CYLNA|nr:unnamed protein product [Cylicocyclus nassatus]
MCAKFGPDRLRNGIFYSEHTAEPGSSSAKSSQKPPQHCKRYQGWIQYPSATTGSFITCSVPDFVKCGRVEQGIQVDTFIKDIWIRMRHCNHISNQASAVADSRTCIKQPNQTLLSGLPTIWSLAYDHNQKNSQPALNGNRMKVFTDHWRKLRLRGIIVAASTVIREMFAEAATTRHGRFQEERQRKKAEQMAFNRRNEPEDKRKKRLAAQAERSRLRRMKETEERRLERLANDTERRKLRRSTETEEQRSLRLRSLADVRRKQRAQNNNLLKQHHSSQEEFGANSREALEENVMGNPSDVARNDAFVAFSTQEATPEADPLQHSGTRDAFSGQRSMINFKDLISQRLNTSEDEFQHNASVPYLDESASRPLPSTSAYVPLKDLTIQPLHDEYVLLTPDPALRVVHFNGAIENNLNALPPQSLPPFSHSHVEHHSNIPFTVLPSTSTELSPTQVC